MTVGIDLGTTNALVAVVDGGTVRLIPNSRGRLVTPSVVGVDAHGELLVGEAAANQAVHRPGHTVRQAKRLMGRRTTVPLGRLYPSPEEVSATILRSLRNAGGRISR